MKEQIQRKTGDPLAEVARIRSGKLSDSETETKTLEGTVEEMLGSLLESDPTAWSEATHRVILGVVEGLGQNGESRLRGVSEAAVLAVARRWGNVVSAGKATVMASREAASAAGMNSVRAAEQASLGAAEGVLRVGPVAFPLLQRELTPLVQNFDVLFQRSRNLPAVVEEKPIIVASREGPTSDEAFDSAEDHGEQAVILTPTRLDPPRAGLVARAWGWLRGLFRRGRA